LRRVAEGQQDPAEVATSLQIVLQLEGTGTELGATLRKLHNPRRLAAVANATIGLISHQQFQTKV
jgi:hypothetical protein